MAATFPLPLASLYDLLKNMEVVFHLPPIQETSGLGSGRVLAADLSDPLWRGSMTMVAMDEADAGSLQAIFEQLDGSIGTFLITNPRRAYPLADPTGGILGAATPSIKATQNGCEIQVKGLPVGYVLTRGDMIGWRDGDAYMLSRIGTTVTANGSGETGWIEVRPHFGDDEPANDTAVTLIKAPMEARLMPGSFDPGSTSGPMITTGMAFEFVQVL